MNIKIVNKSNNKLPEYATIHSAGMDLMANLPEFEIPLTLMPMERKMVPTGIYIKLPEGYEAQIRCRSGMAIKNGISVINGIGTIDSDYIGQVCVLLVNLSDKPFDINHGDRIAQMVINKYEVADWVVVDELESTERGSGGFGHTGVK